ncbi:MAG: DsbA family protein [Pseudomonadota bacterium]
MMPRQINISRRHALRMGTALSISAMLPAAAFAQSLPRPSGSVDMEELLAANALPDMVKGDENAPVTVVEYASMTCGFCALFHNDVWPTIKENYVDTGKVKFIVREFPLDPRAAAAAMLARCAPNDAYFAMVDVLFKQQTAWARAEDARAPLENIAKLAGFTQESFEACLTDQKLLDDVNAIRVRGAEEFGVSSTPTFFIDGDRYSGVLSVEQMSAILDSKL